MSAAAVILPCSAEGEYSGEVAVGVFHGFFLVAWRFLRLYVMVLMMMRLMSHSGGSSIDFAFGGEQTGLCGHHFLLE